MREWDLSQIRPGMEAWDNAGEQIGAVSHVYIPAMAMTGVDRGSAGDNQSILEVKTGLLGLGTHYYVPESAISDVTESGVVLTVARTALDGLGWQIKPAELDNHH